jgi:hypothetical protein
MKSKIELTELFINYITTDNFFVVEVYLVFYAILLKFIFMS